MPVTVKRQGEKWIVRTPNRVHGTFPNTPAGRRRAFGQAQILKRAEKNERGSEKKEGRKHEKSERGEES